MRVRTAALAALTLATVLAVAVSRGDGQTSTYKAPRLPYGGNVPNLNGTWQVANTANWDLEDHQGQAGPIIALGAWGAIPPGQSVVEGNEIPYKADALAKKKENFARRLTLDPEIKCYLPGVPRAIGRSN